MKFNGAGSQRSRMSAGGSGAAVCVVDEVYGWGDATHVALSTKGNSAAATMAEINANMVGTGSAGVALASAINTNTNSNFWAMWDASANTCYVFAKNGGYNNDLLACERVAKGSTATSGQVNTAAGRLSFENVATGQTHDEGTNFSLG